MKIITYPNEILRQYSSDAAFPVSFIKKMKDSMYSNNGIGLSAPQVGINSRVICFDTSIDRNSFNVLINPVIIDYYDFIISEEGCLSIPGISGRVKRYKTIHVSYQDIEGICQENIYKDIDAICVQHEIDHLNGILFIDKIIEFDNSRVLKQLKKYKKNVVSQNSNSGFN
jgi:peptide deformylase